MYSIVSQIIWQKYVYTNKILVKIVWHKYPGSSWKYSETSIQKIRLVLHFIAFSYRIWSTSITELIYLPSQKWKTTSCVHTWYHCENREIWACKNAVKCPVGLEESFFIFSTNKTHRAPSVKQVEYPIKWQNVKEEKNTIHISDNRKVVFPVAQKSN